MVIEKTAMAGTLESSDAQVTVSPADTLEIVIESSVINQYGRQIKQTVVETLGRLGVESGLVSVVDKGALDCTVQARTIAAVYRAAGNDGAFDWKEIDAWNA